MRSNRHVDDLLAQASRLMESDPGHYFEHWSVWLSLHALKMGRPWPPEEKEVPQAEAGAEERMQANRTT